MIKDRIIELTRVRAGDLRPSPKNWRRHPDTQRKAMQAALTEIGFADALLARRTDDGLELIDGHLRAELDSEQQVPVLVLDVDEQEAGKLLATLDPLASLAETDLEALKLLASDLDFQMPDLEAVVADLVGPEGVDAVVEDIAPEPPTDPVTRPGDIWLLGNHRLVCGDATNAEDVGRVLDGRQPTLMVTDPPYGVAYDPEWRKRAGINNSDRMGKVSNDDRVDWREAYQLFTGDVAYIWHAGRFTSSVADSIEACGFEVRAQIIWRKPRFAISRGHYHWQHEPAWYAVRQGRTAHWCGDRSQTTIWDIANVPDTGVTNHGTQKPVEAMARPMRNHESDVVYDPFLGSGTTLIAAEQLGRTCVGLEIDPAYCDVIVQRWENLTQQKAKLTTGPSEKAPATAEASGGGS